MALIGGRLVKGKISFPCKGSVFFIEDNIGDENPIHIHMGPNAKQIGREKRVNNTPITTIDT